MKLLFTKRISDPKASCPLRLEFWEHPDSPGIKIMTLERAGLDEMIFETNEEVRLFSAALIEAAEQIA